MPTCAFVPSVSSGYTTKAERAFYLTYSRRHPPKERVGLFEREERFMETLRAERTTKGYRCVPGDEPTLASPAPANTCEWLQSQNLGLASARCCLLGPS